MICNPFWDSRARSVSRQTITSKSFGRVLEDLRTRERERKREDRARRRVEDKIGEEKNEREKREEEEGGR